MANKSVTSGLGDPSLVSSRVCFTVSVSTHSVSFFLTDTEYLCRDKNVLNYAR